MVPPFDIPPRAVRVNLILIVLDDWLRMGRPHPTKSQQPPPDLWISNLVTDTIGRGLAEQPRSAGSDTAFPDLFTFPDQPLTPSDLCF